MERNLIFFRILSAQSRRATFGPPCSSRATRIARKSRTARKRDEKVYRITRLRATRALLRADFPPGDFPAAQLDRTTRFRCIRFHMYTRIHTVPTYTTRANPRDDFRATSGTKDDARVDGKREKTAWAAANRFSSIRRLTRTDFRSTPARPETRRRRGNPGGCHGETGAMMNREAGAERKGESEKWSA